MMYDLLSALLNSAEGGPVEGMLSASGLHTFRSFPSLYTRSHC
jgi:hypothetical protein